MGNSLFVVGRVVNATHTHSEHWVELSVQESIGTIPQQLSAWEDVLHVFAGPARLLRDFVIRRRLSPLR